MAVVPQNINTTLGHASPGDSILRRFSGRKAQIAVSTQGGGQRGIFTAGVFDSFIRAGFDPFSLYFGTSAGALNISSFLARQHGYGYQFIHEITTSPRFFHLIKYLRRQQYMDLDWALEKGLGHPSNPLDIESARATLSGSGRRAYAAVTDTYTLKDDYLPLLDGDWMSTLKATCAIPFLYSGPVKVGDKHYIDGGVSAAIPVKEAYYRGADIVVVIRTEPVEASEGIGVALLENWREKIEDKLPDYLARLNLTDRLNKLQGFHDEMSHRLSNIRQLTEKRPVQDDEGFLSRLRDVLPNRIKANGERWLFGGQQIYRLQAITGQSLSADMMNMLVHHYQSYHDIESFIADPPSRVHILQIAPEKPLESKALLSTQEELDNDYQAGVEAGHRFLRQYAELLTAVTNTVS